VAKEPPPAEKRPHATGAKPGEIEIFLRVLDPLHVRIEGAVMHPARFDQRGVEVRPDLGTELSDSVLLAPIPGKVLRSIGDALAVLTLHEGREQDLAWGSTIDAKEEGALSAERHRPPDDLDGCVVSIGEEVIDLAHAGHDMPAASQTSDINAGGTAPECIVYEAAKRPISLANVSALSSSVEVGLALICPSLLSAPPPTQAQA
jgi:hypothetical protein